MGSPEVGDCDGVMRHVWVYLDRETDPPTCAELEAHLAECEACQRVVQFDRKFKMLVRRCADAAPLEPARVEALRVRLVATLRSQRRSRPV